MTTATRTLPRHDEIAADIERLGPWFHNLHLLDGSQTAPDHRLGDFPSNKWRHVAPHVPADLTGWTALDVGCNAGFYSFELARRGARVTAIDCDEHYLDQARWAAERFGLSERLAFRRMQVYHLAHLPDEYDLVWFMGVFYHLRYPILGLDVAARKARRMLVFQTLAVPGDEVARVPENFGLDERDQMRQPGWPSLAFIEHRMADDPTNWWAPNHACCQALLRSCGFGVVARPAPEIYVCEPRAAATAERAPLLDEEYLAATGQSRPQ